MEWYVFYIRQEGGGRVVTAFDSKRDRNELEVKLYEGNREWVQLPVIERTNGTKVSVVPDKMQAIRLDTPIGFEVHQL